MTHVFILFPHQLFADCTPLFQAQHVYLVEEYLFFNQYAFHKQKLVFHRASMQYYQGYLQQQKCLVTYVEAHTKLADVRKLLIELANQGVSHITAYRVQDNWLHKRIIQTAAAHHLTIKWLDTPMFLLNDEERNAQFAGKTAFFQTTFYTAQRKKMAILVDDFQKPLGGKWTFDAENRLPYPKAKTPPQWQPIAVNSWVKEAQQYVTKNYASNPGNLSGSITYPVTHEEAVRWLDDFLENRFYEFGAYEDAIVSRAHVLHHSVLTPMLNVGLLTPQQVLNSALHMAEQKGVPLNSVEGFVRQLIGWREFIAGVYAAAGTQQRTRNYWQFTRKIPHSFYEGTTGIKPVDTTIKKLMSSAYSHHIERLMIMSNFMLLCEFDPDEVYQWFMELYIDAYDWVMVPNVYGMGQFADGGMMCTKPYISGSNYITKMSDYAKGEPWAEIWDALFWRFMHVHRTFFLQNPRLGMLVRTFDKMSSDKQKAYLVKAEQFLNRLDYVEES